MKNFKVNEGVYVPDMGLTYDEKDPYVRMYKPTYDRVCKVDEHYPFVDNSLKYRFLTCTMHLLVLNVAERIYLRLNTGLRFKGRTILKKYKKELAGGYISIANHTLPHDCESVLLAIGAKHTVKIPMFQKNFETSNQFWLKVVGGIPIPPAEEGLSAMKKFNEAFDEFHRRGYCFHIFPEMSKWPYYTPLRPFQKGAFTMAYKYQMPILPCAITYRERTGIFKLFGKANEPLITVEIGEPIFPDKSQPRKQDVERMLQESHASMRNMMGIIDNPWPASADDLPKE